MRRGQDASTSAPLPGEQTYLKEALVIVPEEVGSRLEWLSSYKNEELDHKDRLQTLLGRLSNDKVVWKAGIHQTAQLAKKLGKQPDITKGTPEEHQLRRWATIM